MECMVINNKAMDEVMGEMEGPDITSVVGIDGKMETDIIELTKINGGRHNTRLVRGGTIWGLMKGNSAHPIF